MASFLKIAAFFFASATTATLALPAATDSGSALFYTTGGQGFHRHLLMHVPLDANAAVNGDNGGADKKKEDTTGTSVFSLTFGMRLRNTFFIDVAEAESQWDTKVLTIGQDTGSAQLATQFATTAVSRGSDIGFVKSVTLQHPIATKYPYDIEAATVKTPYLFNEANVTFEVTIDNAKLLAAAAASSSSSSNSNKLLMVLSIPIHERYEDVTTDPETTHVTRCVEKTDIAVSVNTVEGDGRDSYGPLKNKEKKKRTDRFAAQIKALPIQFTQMEDTALILSAVGIGGAAASKASIVSDNFCVKVPVGYLGDLPLFYWSTMAMMVVGACSVWAGLTFV